jgi:hypothetical protein
VEFNANNTTAVTEIKMVHKSMMQERASERYKIDLSERDEKR